jgi:2',3'-cyclic-nucleotide 2'-phosphodiesterase (5'-nucleotidase family)
MSRKIVYLILFGAGLGACSFFNPRFASSDRIEMNVSRNEDSTISSFIQPFQDSISLQMDELIGFSTEALIKGRPCSPLNNWVVDALFSNQVEKFQEITGPKLVLLNVGGLRSTINKGPISIGDIYTLMPFDNKVVWVKLPVESLFDIQNYIIEKDGEPIGNARFNNGALVLKDSIKDTYFWVITSDYLADGGDKMSFFEKQLDRFETNMLLRDVFIESVKKQDTLIINNECRIELE